MHSRYFEDFQIGEEFITKGRTITDADLVNFAGLSGNFNPIHMDEKFAACTPFKRRVVHGLLTLSILLGLWDRLGLVEDTVVAHAAMTDVRFLRPVFVGDTLYARIRVLDKQDSGRLDRGVLLLEAKAFNQNEEEVLYSVNHLVILKKTYGNMSRP